MAKIGTPLNVSDSATNGEISVGSGSAVTLVSAKPMRFSLYISNPSNKNAWIKFQAASVDNTKTGILLPQNSSWSMQPNDKYTGEVSIIMDSGGTKDIHFIEM